MPSFEMPKTYDPGASETRIYEWWEKSGFFKPEIAAPDAEPFVISIPPPNITGELHLGHAMFVSLEDETGSVQVIVWPKLKAQLRGPLLRSKLMAVKGTWQRDGDVRNLIAGHVEDLTALLGGLATSSRDFH